MRAKYTTANNIYNLQRLSYNSNTKWFWCCWCCSFFIRAGASRRWCGLRLWSVVALTCIIASAVLYNLDHCFFKCWEYSHYRRVLRSNPHASATNIPRTIYPTDNAIHKNSLVASPASHSDRLKVYLNPKKSAIIGTPTVYFISVFIFCIN